MNQVFELSKLDKYSSAYRKHFSPVERLTYWLEKQGRIEEALKVIHNFYFKFDPLQPSNHERKKINKRFERLLKLTNKTTAG